MRPETGAFMRRSTDFLAKAEAMLEQGWSDEAGRAAYLAGFHAAQALIFERTGRTLKTHAGVQTEFAKLVRDDPGLDVEQRRFLPRAYNLKTVADYGIDPADQVTPAQAREAILVARRLTEGIADLLPRPGAAPPAPG